MVPVPRVPTSRGSTRGLYYFIVTGTYWYFQVVQLAFLTFLKDCKREWKIFQIVHTSILISARPSFKILLFALWPSQIGDRILIVKDERGEILKKRLSEDIKQNSGYNNWTIRLPYRITPKHNNMLLFKILPSS
jgi:hypothetical protein